MSLLTLGGGAFSLHPPPPPPPSFLSLCSCIDLVMEGSRGTGDRGRGYLGNGDLCVCTRAEYPSSFSSLSHYIPLHLPPSLSHSTLPIPLSSGPRAVAVTLALAVKSDGPNLPQPQPQPEPSPNKQHGGLNEHELNKHAFTHTEKTLICHAVTRDLFQWFNVSPSRLNGWSV